MHKQLLIEHIMKDQIGISKKLLTHYNKLGISEVELVVIMQIYRFQLDNSSFPTFQELAQYLSIGEQQCAQILRLLRQNGFLSIEQEKNSQNVINEWYSLEPLWKKLYEEQNEDDQAIDIDQTNLFLLFEQEFGRALSPFEIETISLWLDEDLHEPSLIKAALREAVLMGKLNFRYIDRILREWKKKGVKTVEQARKESQAFHKAKAGTQSEQRPKRDTSIYYNWLTDEE